MSKDQVHGGINAWVLSLCIALTQSLVSKDSKPFTKMFSPIKLFLRVGNSPLMTLIIMLVSELCMFQISHKVKF